MTAAKKKATATGKETIYVDVDDEITHVIDKIKSSDKKIIALVLPKRATVLQSIVNMKLLKKAATNAKKSVVLITSEAALLPLAGAAGLHVAKSLQSKPVIPPLPDQMDDSGEEEIDLADDSSTLDRSAAIGTLAAASIAKDDETETVEFDNLKVDDEPVAPTSKKQKNKKLKKLKVPNFERFRLGFVLAGLGVVLLIVGWIFAAIILPKANITIKTDTTSVVSSFDFTASTTQPELDVNDKKIPATLKESKKTDTAKVPATGERDDGTKSSGEVTLSVPCTVTTTITVPAGTAVSTGGNNYVTQQAASLDTPSGGPGGCRFRDTVNILAAENGDKYNAEAGKTFSVAGFSSVSGTNNGALTGGTSKIVKIVSQKDVDDATNQITQKQGTGASDELKAALEAEGLYPLAETLVTKDPSNKVTPEVGKEASEVTVSSEINYSMLGVKRDELAQLIKKDIEDEVDFQKQSIIDDGIGTAIMRINNNTTPGQAFISFRTSVIAGPEINEEEIKEFARGKKRGEIEDHVESIPGVQEAVVTYSPFWVYSTPKAAKKITVTIEKPQEAQTGNQETTNE